MEMGLSRTKNGLALEDILLVFSVVISTMMALSTSQPQIWRSDDVSVLLNDGNGDFSEKPEVVFEFSPLISSQYFFSTNGAGGLSTIGSSNTVMVLFTDCEDPIGTQIACDAGGQSDFSAFLEAGQTYFIAVEGRFTFGVGETTILTVDLFTTKTQTPTPFPTVSSSLSPSPSLSPVPSLTPQPSESVTATPPFSPSLTPITSPTKTALANQQPPTSASLRILLAVEVGEASFDPEGGTVSYRYIWSSNGDDDPVTHGPKPELFDVLFESENDVNFDEGEVWAVTVIPVDEDGLEGPHSIGRFIIGSNGMVTFTGWVFQ